MNTTKTNEGISTVYLTRDISPESLVKIYKALGVEAKGRVAVKMSTGEGSNPNYLKPELIKNLIYEVDGTIVECNTAYSSGPDDEQDDRNTSANHWKVIERHGFLKYFPVDIMDEYDEMRVPVKDQTNINYDIVGGHMANDGMAYTPLTKLAQEEADKGELPPYEGKAPDLAKYDTVFIGGPVWWGTYPQVMFTLFRDINLDGKTVIPFTTHEGSGLASCVSDVKKAFSKANVTKGFSSRPQYA